MYQKALVSAGANPLGVTVIVLDTLLLSIAAIALGIRLRSRKIQRVNLTLHDYAVLVAWV